MTSIGERIYELRTERSPRLTQAALAERAGVSVDLISKLEQGRKQSASIKYLTKIARALDTSLAELVSRPGRLVGDVEPDGSGLQELRRALTPLAAPPASEASLPEVKAALDQAWATYYETSDFDALAAVLPGLIADAQGHPHQLAEAYRLAACVVSRIGVEDLGYIAGAKALEVASSTDDPHLKTAAEATLSWVYLNQGRGEEGLAFAAKRIEALEPRFGSATHIEVAAWGNLVVTGATAASRAGQPDTADELLRLAGAAAAITGERIDYYTSFGPGQVAMQTVDTAVVNEDYTGALHSAKLGAYTISTQRSVMRARHLEDVALAQTRLRRDGEAVDTLASMERLAPKWMAYEPAVRSMVTELIDRERRVRTPALRGLANRLQLSARLG